MVVGELSLSEFRNSFLRAKTSLSTLQSQCNPCGGLCSTGIFVICCKIKISRMKHRKLLQRNGNRESMVDSKPCTQMSPEEWLQ